eukprot:1760834-Amphidinium_carterae.1
MLPGESSECKTNWDVQIQVAVWLLLEEVHDTGEDRKRLAAPKAKRGFSKTLDINVAMAVFLVGDLYADLFLYKAPTKVPKSVTMIHTQRSKTDMFEHLGGGLADSSLAGATGERWEVHKRLRLNTICSCHTSR